MAKGEGASRRRSIYENVEKLCEKSERLRSFFEKPNLTTQEKEKAEALLQEWNEKWGKYNLDYVNVVKYPEEYVQKIKEEREMWLKGLDDFEEKAVIIEQDSKFDVVINEDILPTDQKASLRVIDSQINKYIEKATTFLKEFEAYKRRLEIRLEKIEKERDMIEKIAVRENSLV